MHGKGPELLLENSPSKLSCMPYKTGFLKSHSATSSV